MALPSSRKYGRYGYRKIAGLLRHTSSRTTSMRVDQL
jgi:hypothetical protein